MASAEARSVQADVEGAAFDATQYGIFADSSVASASLEELGAAEEQPLPPTDDDEEEDIVLQRALAEEQHVEEVFIPHGDHAESSSATTVPHSVESGISAGNVAQDLPQPSLQPGSFTPSVHDITRRMSGAVLDAAPEEKPSQTAAQADTASSQSAFDSPPHSQASARRKRKEQPFHMKGRQREAVSTHRHNQQAASITQQQQQQSSSKEQKKIAGEWMSSDEVGRLLRIQHAATHPPGLTAYEYDYYAQAIASKKRGGRHPPPSSGQEAFRPPPAYTTDTAHGDDQKQQQKQPEQAEHHEQSNTKRSPVQDETAERDGNRSNGKREFAPLNALGKIPLSNLRAPKPCVDIDIASSGGAGDTGRELAHEPGVAARLLIEQAESYVLAADDAARALGAPKSGDPTAKELDQRRAALLKGATSLLNLAQQPLPSSLSADAVASHVLRLPKGRSLVARLLSRPLPLDALGPMAWAVARQSHAPLRDDTLSESLASALSRPECSSEPSIIVGVCVVLSRCTSLDELPKGVTIAALFRASSLLQQGELQEDAKRAVHEAASAIVKLVLARSANDCPPELARALDGLLSLDSVMALRQHFVTSARTISAVGTTAPSQQVPPQQRQVSQPMHAQQQQQALVQPQQMPHQQSARAAHTVAKPQQMAHAQYSAMPQPSYQLRNTSPTISPAEAHKGMMQQQMTPTQAPSPYQQQPPAQAQPKQAQAQHLSSPQAMQYPSSNAPPTPASAMPAMMMQQPQQPQQPQQQQQQQQMRSQVQQSGPQRYPAQPGPGPQLQQPSVSPVSNAQVIAGQVPPVEPNGSGRGE